MCLKFKTVDDVAVRFYEQDVDGQLKWEGFGCFGPADVHRQVNKACNKNTIKAKKIICFLATVCVTFDPRIKNFYCISSICIKK